MAMLPPSTTTTLSGSLNTVGAPGLEGCAEARGTCTVAMPAAKSSAVSSLCNSNVACHLLKMLTLLRKSSQRYA